MKGRREFLGVEGIVPEPWRDLQSLGDIFFMASPRLILSVSPVPPKLPYEPCHNIRAETSPGAEPHRVVNRRCRRNSLARCLPDLLDDRLVVCHPRERGDHGRPASRGERMPRAPEVTRIVKALKEFHQRGAGFHSGVMIRGPSGCISHKTWV
jgi:hypothetical protein